MRDAVGQNYAKRNALKPWPPEPPLCISSRLLRRAPGHDAYPQDSSLPKR